MNVKRLSLQNWMTLVESFDWRTIASGLKEIPVVFQKEGWYFKDKYSWWEYKGKAYTSLALAEQFSWELKHILSQDFTEKEANQLSKVCKFLKNPIKKKIQEELRLWEHKQEIKRIIKHSKLFSLKHRKKK